MYRAALSLLVVVLLAGAGCNRKSSAPRNTSVFGSGQIPEADAGQGAPTGSPVMKENDSVPSQEVGLSGTDDNQANNSAVRAGSKVNTKAGVSMSYSAPATAPAPKPTPAPAPAPAPATVTAPPQNTAKVVINSSVLSETQLNEFAENYGQRPDAGNYWYDGKSGLYGAVGYQAFGFMLPGHSYGRLSRIASNGNTGVFINGRELPAAEWLIWGQIVGSPIQSGSYWLDAQGNAGYEGSNLPLINLYLAAAARSYGGSGGGGDNFWSSRFSAGNYNDQGQGYVSVPGYGPVGYGF